MKHLLMITLSNHTSFQDGVFSMYENLKTRYKVSTITIADSSYPVSEDKDNYFIRAPLRPGITRGTFNFKELHRMMALFRKIPADVVYFESLHVWNYPLILSCKLRGITVAHAINDVDPHAGDGHARMNIMLNGLTAFLADKIILRSADGFRKAKTSYPKYAFKMGKVDLWYSFPPYREPEGNTILYFGRMNKYKGIDKLAELIQTTPELKYIVVGKSNESVAEYVEAIKKMPNARVEDKIVPYDEMHQYFYSSACIVLPYESATQSGVILDSCKHSRPAIAFNVGALGEQIMDGSTGYLIPPGDVAQMAQKVRELVQMPKDEYRKMCHAAYEYGVQHYSAKSKEKKFLSSVENCGSAHIRHW